MILNKKLTLRNRQGLKKMVGKLGRIREARVYTVCEGSGTGRYGL